jgi:hypothetical protein
MAERVAVDLGRDIELVLRRIGRNLVVHRSIGVLVEIRWKRYPEGMPGNLARDYAVRLIGPIQRAEVSIDYLVEAPAIGPGLVPAPGFGESKVCVDVGGCSLKRSSTSLGLAITGQSIEILDIRLGPDPVEATIKGVGARALVNVAGQSHNLEIRT